MHLRPQWVVGAAAVLVAVGFVLGTRFAPSPDTDSAAVARLDPRSPVAGDASREPTAQPARLDDALCADDEGSAAAHTVAADEPTLGTTKSRLFVSQNAENLTSIALLSVEEPRERLDAMRRAMSVGRGEPIVVWAAVQICDHPRPDLSCPAQEWEDELLKLDSENSEVWIRVAARRYERGDTAKALDALQHAATAAETREYWPETVEMLERALDSAGGYSFPQRAALAFSVADANLPDPAPYVNMCGRQSRVDAEWAQACLEYGRLVERQAKTEIGLSIAQTIQIAALESARNTEEALAAAARRDDAARDRMSESARERIDVFVLSNTRVFAAYLAALRERGERAARTEALAEANRLADRCSQQPANSSNVTTHDADSPR